MYYPISLVDLKEAIKTFYICGLTIKCNVLKAVKYFIILN